MREIIEKLEGLRRKHHECEDGWYSCPLTDEYIGDEGPGCNCGAEAHNRKLDEIIQELKKCAQ